MYGEYFGRILRLGTHQEKDVDDGEGLWREG